MANNYFQFKQFIIYQDMCAMKVCTDACLFGAWAAGIIKNEELKTKNLLDIGAGTGLLSLMIAQKTIAAIDAIEIDQAAFDQAKQNFDGSAWKERLRIHYSSMQDFTGRQKEKYDIIVSNPPFYENDLKSDNDKKNKAKHNTTLTLPELAEYAANNLTEDGSFFILLPFHRINDFVAAAGKNDLFLLNELLVNQTPSHDFFRGCLQFSKKREPITVSKIFIKDAEGNYSTEFASLLKDYYLNL